MKLRNYIGIGAKKLGRHSSLGIAMHRNLTIET